MTTEEQSTQVEAQATEAEPPRRRRGGRKAVVNIEEQPFTPGKNRAAVESPSRPRGGEITVQQYNEMWDAYCEQQSVEHVVKATRITRRTVAKYVTGGGDPKRGLSPIAERFKRSMAMAQAEDEMSLVRYRKEQFELVGKSINLMTGEMMLLQEDIKRRIAAFKDGKGQEPPRVATSLDKLTQSLDRMVRLGERLLGGPDHVQESRGEAWYAEWTTEEMVEFAASGKIPERDRARLSGDVE